MPTLLTADTAIYAEGPPWSPDEAQVAVAQYNDLPLGTCGSHAGLSRPRTTLRIGSSAPMRPLVFSTPGRFPDTARCRRAACSTPAR